MVLIFNCDVNFNKSNFCFDEAKNSDILCIHCFEDSSNHWMNRFLPKNNIPINWCLIWHLVLVRRIFIYFSTLLYIIYIYLYLLMNFIGLYIFLFYFCFVSFRSLLFLSSYCAFSISNYILLVFFDYNMQQCCKLA